MLLSPPLTEEEIEAQRREVTCPEAQSREMADGAQGGLYGEAGAWAPGCRARGRPPKCMCHQPGSQPRTLRSCDQGAPACLHPASQAPGSKGHPVAENPRSSFR